MYVFIRFSRVKSYLAHRQRFAPGVFELRHKTRRRRHFQHMCDIFVCVCVCARANHVTFLTADPGAVYRLRALELTVSRLCRFRGVCRAAPGVLVIIHFPLVIITRVCCAHV